MSAASHSQSEVGQIAIVVLTYGRVHLLSQCVENVLSRTSAATREILIWDNGSTDGTAEYLATVDDPRVRVIRHSENIGQSAYARSFAQTTSRYLLELDDDMIEAPAHWDLTLLRAFRQLPDVGFLAASLVDNPHDPSAHAMYYVHKYTEVVESGVRLMIGPTGGGCAITSREIYDAVGGFPEDSRRVFFSEDGAYADAVRRAGYRAATMAELKLLHAGGPYYSKQPTEKIEFWRAYQGRVARKLAVKRALLRIPGLAALNSRYSWFEPPDRTDDDGLLSWLDSA